MNWRESGIDYEPFLIWNTFHFRRKVEKLSFLLRLSLLQTTASTVLVWIGETRCQTTWQSQRENESLESMARWWGELQTSTFMPVSHYTNLGIASFSKTHRILCSNSNVRLLDRSCVPWSFAGTFSFNPITVTSVTKNYAGCLLASCHDHYLDTYLWRNLDPPIAIQASNTIIAALSRIHPRDGGPRSPGRMLLHT